MALVGLVFVLVGVIGGLRSAVDAAVPTCPVFEEELHPAQPIPVPEEGLAEEPPSPPVAEPVSGTAVSGPGACWPSPADAGRQAVNSGIVVLVAGPVLWWHLRRGRRLTGPEPGPEPGE